MNDIEQIKDEFAVLTETLGGRILLWVIVFFATIENQIRCFSWHEAIRSGITLFALALLVGVIMYFAYGLN